MNSAECLKLVCVLIYALFPYSALYLITQRKSIEQTWIILLKASVWGIVGLIIAGIAISSQSLRAYSIVHFSVAVLVVVPLLITSRILWRRPTLLSLLPVALMIAAGLVRLAPFFPYTDWLGSGDMRFHNILANSIILNDHLPRTWEPFAQIPVNYPLGSHFIAAFTSFHSGLKVHTVLIVTLCLYGALSTGLIYLISCRLFKDSYAAAISAIAYGFIALAGSLDYARWGGIPNACAMTLILLFVAEILDKEESGSQSRCRVLMFFIPTAIILAHHYSALALFLLIGGVVVLSPSRSIIWKPVAWTAVGTVFALLLLSVIGSLPEPTTAGTSVFKFYEHPMSIMDVISQMNPAFALIGCIGVYFILKRKMPDRTAILTAWITSYALAFVFLEYCYRITVFMLSNGSEFYTALTPSRLIADSAYPLSIAAGGIVFHRAFETYRKQVIAILVAVGIASSLLLFVSMQSVESIPDIRPTIEWLATHTAPNAVITAGLPHMEYLTWRKSTHPPIPASEARNSPSLLELRSLYSAAQWREYASKNKVNCYFVRPANAFIPAELRPVYSNSTFVTCILIGDDER